MKSCPKAQNILQTSCEAFFKKNRIFIRLRRTGSWILISETSGLRPGKNNGPCGDGTLFHWSFIGSCSTPKAPMNTMCYKQVKQSSRTKRCFPGIGFKNPPWFREIILGMWFTILYLKAFPGPPQADKNSETFWLSHFF